MTSFFPWGLGLTAAWLLLVAIGFRKSRPALLGGMALIGAYILIGVQSHTVDLAQLGLETGAGVLLTGASAVLGLMVILIYSPLADWIAGQFVKTPPDLHAFKGLKDGPAKLILGIIAAWILGGFLEEVIFRGLVQNGVQALLPGELPPWGSAAIAIAVAALGAGIIHLYQGLKAALIITQLSALFGLLFVLSGHNLWAVILAHGLYDTIAFIRYATGASKYSKTVEEAPDEPEEVTP